MKTQQKNRFRRLRGHTLVEVLIGVFITGLCAMILGATMPIANNSRRMAANNTKALSLAQKHMERIRTAGYANVTATRLLAVGLIDSTATVATNTYSITNVDSGNNDSIGQTMPSGTGTILVEQADIELRRVIITITWREDGRNKTLRLGSTIANL